MLDVHHFSVPLSDGRELEVFEAGERDWPLVLIHNGTPTGGGLLTMHIVDAEARHLRLASYSRPGYGGSTRLPGRSVAQAAADALSIADHLGAERFATWGISGGGPHALACAALLPDRVVAAASLAAVAPHELLENDFLVGMGQENIDEFSAALAGETALTAHIAAANEGMREAVVAEAVEAMRSLLSPEDLAVFTGEFGQELVQTMRDGLAPGFYGWLDDDLAFVRPWGFDLQDIRVPLQIWQGRRDLMVPYEHGRRIAQALPDAQRHLSEVDGHLTLYARRVPEVHAWIAQHF